VLDALVGGATLSENRKAILVDGKPTLGFNALLTLLPNMEAQGWFSDDQFCVVM
jgi:hypothetical protein